jgi:hypothetical protein
MTVERITFDRMKDMWDAWVWPSTAPNPPVDTSQYLGGNDVNIVKKYTPTYAAIKEGGLFIAALGGHRTTSHMYRLRGLYLYENIDKSRYAELSKSLLGFFISIARSEGCNCIWDLVPLEHEWITCGFTIEEADPTTGLYYIIKRI